MDAALEQRIAESIRSHTISAVPKTPARKVLELLEAPKKIAPPNTCPEPFPGPMETLFHLSIGQQHRPQPALTVAAALCAMSSCMHGRYATQDGLRGNLYVVGLAGTGAGKSGPLDLVKALVSASGNDRHTMSNIGSGQGLEDALAASEDRRVNLTIDEIGHMLGALGSAKSSPYENATGKALLELYSASGSVYVTRLLANSEKPPEVLYHPYTSLFGVTTHAKMKGISPGLIEDGLLGRVLMVSGEDFVDQRKIVNPSSVFGQAEGKLGAVARKVSAFGDPMRKPEEGVTRLSFDSDADALLDRAMAHFDVQARKADGAKRALCARGLEQVKRIALVLAVWSGAATINREQVKWGLEFVTYSHHCLLAFVETMTDSPVVAAAQKIEQIMRDAIGGKTPFAGPRSKYNEVAREKGIVNHSALLHRSKLGSRDFMQAIDHMIQSQVIETESMDSAAVRGPQTQVYYRLLP
ncbi:hypothetical protein AWB64_00471 [Caballeronia sordidicola]|uniref:DUF3987 domain-containing protein n=1 Tax=Caballeronia sordidicola TaxID=196367 RepID=A0A158EX08_CABSO|nr:DUF3987 domain-containing protein [Caballeronia sordidicola]SAL12062.1 hypothetical protein AWB64_00471 [Caballeronia sordidicola]